MRFAIVSVSVLAALSQLVSAVPTLERRASATEKPTIGYAAQGSTTGGIGGSTITVTSLAALTSAVASDSAKIVIVSGTITGNTVVKVGSNTSLLGKSGSSLVGVGLRVNKKNNVIIRNLKISKVLASAGDALGIQEASKVWVDHVDLSSDRDHDKDFYDGLLDVTHGSTFVSITNSNLHDHYKASLVGHSDNNESEDKKITVTYALNRFSNLNSRMPSFRFGTGHLFNNYFVNSNDGINTRLGAQLLVENNVWEGVKKPLYATDNGFAVARGNDFGGASNSAPTGTFSKAPYSYTLLDAGKVKSTVSSSAGATLDF
ncbi:pectate lyase [Rhizoctonia solani]|uniref:Pectate lyase n=1 Tax=Rhizoctonia solani TaxID=456999 RepID=A0A8H8NV39_9AGAM|nr:pectate lyase [Rhizoctonia solani]QRW19895.1 pectate lyase [Rhizoctonia solani]